MGKYLQVILRFRDIFVARDFCYYFTYKRTHFEQLLQSKRQSCDRLSRFCIFQSRIFRSGIYRVSDKVDHNAS